MIKSQIESLLFISAKPIAVSQIVEILKADESEVTQAIDELARNYRESQSGIQIVKSGSKYQMASSQENAQVVQAFIQDETTGELSRPSLEALTIIAYRGPITKLELERIRGVNCSLIIRNLLLRGLIEGKLDKEKNDTVYSVTLDFVRFMGINDVAELPDFDKLSQDPAIDQVLTAANV